MESKSEISMQREETEATPPAPQRDLANELYGRALGKTERNWLKAVERGTGHTVIGLLFRNPLPIAAVQVALREVQIQHPRTRSRMIDIDGHPAFQVASDPYLQLEVIDDWTAPESSEDDMTPGGSARSSAEMTTRSSDVEGRIRTAVSTADRPSAGSHGSCSSLSAFTPGAAAKGKRIPPLPPMLSAELDDDILREAEATRLTGVGREAGGEEEGAADEEGDRFWDAQGGEGQGGVRSTGDGGGDGEEGPFQKLPLVGRFRLSLCPDKWLRIVEAEMNAALGAVGGTGDLMAARMYNLPSCRSVLILRAHTCICDRVSAAAMTATLLASLDRTLNPNTTPNPLPPHLSPPPPSPPPLLSVEASIPKGAARKPFWAHSVDVIGYGVGSKRNAYLPFQDSAGGRRSALIRSGLDKDATDALLQACTHHGCQLYGALCAGALLGAARSRGGGERQSQFAVTTLLDTRPLLDPPLSPTTAGFYHSALLNSHSVSEETPFWEVAARCQVALDRCIEHRKHFTDMGDLNMLMAQAMEHPGLTPSSSLRTSMLVAFRDLLEERMQPYESKLGIEDYVGASSIHGVGPCLAIFDSIREDGLHLANVYPTPLFSRAQMKGVIIRMMELLQAAADGKVA